MTNPEIFTVTVTDVATLLFAGCGKFRVTSISENGTFVLGNSAVAYGGPGTWFLSNPGEFKADGELYARCLTGQSCVVRVERWF